MRKKLLVRGELAESAVKDILNPILLGIDRTPHKVTYRTIIGVVEYVSMPSGSSLDRYGDAVVSDTFRKIFIWSRHSVEELEERLRSKGVRWSSL